MEEEQPNEEFFAKFADIKQILYNKLLKYLKVGEFPKADKGLYLDIYNFIHNYGNEDYEALELYNYFNEVIKEYATEFAKQINGKSNIEIIDAFIDRCNRMDILIPFLEKTFSFLDFYYCKIKKFPTLLENALKTYKVVLFMPFQEIITTEVNKLLKEDRCGKKENRIKIKRILSIMKTMDLSKPKIKKENLNNVWVSEESEEILEEKEKKKKKNKLENKPKEEIKTKTPIQDYWFNLFKEDTEQFFRVKAEKDIQNSSTPEYVLEELKYLEEENERQFELINEIYYKRLNNIIYKEIIGKNMVDLVDMDSGVKHMLEDNKFKDLSNLYELFKLYEPSLHEISRLFIDYIKKKGNELKENKEISNLPQKFIPELINLQNEINYFVLECFKNNFILQNAKIKGFGDLMRPDFYSKQIAFYIDYCMRNEFKGKSQEYIDKTLNDIIELFKNLTSKLLFGVESEKKMSERLIKGKSLSMNNEKNFVSKLKQESELSFVEKMVGMISDIENNNILMEGYKNSQSKGKPNGIKFNVQVISLMPWDVNSDQLIKIKIPKLLSSCVEDFEKYYINKYEHHKLIWYYIYSTVEIQYLYLNNRNISISTLPQILILLALEQSGTLSIKKLTEICGCETELIKDGIQGLIFNPTFNPKSDIKKGVINPINTESKDFKENDEFKINTDFKNQKIRFSTIPLPKKKTQAEIDNEEKQSEIDYQKYRKSLIKSNLVRIMKARIGQETTHSWLVGETAKQITIIKAQPQEIKAMIEKLIEDDFLKRNENKKDCYEYVA